MLASVLSFAVGLSHDFSALCLDLFLPVKDTILKVSEIILVFVN